MRILLFQKRKRIYKPLTERERTNARRGGMTGFPVKDRTDDAGTGKSARVHPRESFLLNKKRAVIEMENKNGEAPHGFI